MANINDWKYTIEDVVKNAEYKDTATGKVHVELPTSEFGGIRLNSSVLIRMGSEGRV